MFIILKGTTQLCLRNNRIASLATRDIHSTYR